MPYNNKPYRIPASTYADAYKRRDAGILFALLVLPTATCVVAGCFDIRWFFIAFMWVMISLPALNALGWYGLMAQPDMVLRLHPQRISMDNGALVLNFFEYQQLEQEDTSADTTDDEPIPYRTVVIPISDIKDVRKGTTHVTITFRHGARFDFILIPNGELSPQQIAILIDGQ